MSRATYESLSVWYLGTPSNPESVGTVALDERQKKLTFRYSAAWIEGGFDLSPDMPRFAANGRPNTAPILASADRAAPGAIEDAMPDRWGQTVIRMVDRPERLTPLDFLYYAGDRRFGSLGVSIERDAYIPHPLPPLPQIAALPDAARLIDRVLANPVLDERERLLLASGRTMGGAQPKMLVDIDGHEWIAKLPKGDPVDVLLIEHATMRLARDIGIRSAETAVHDIGIGHVLLVKRFDRDGAQRHHAISAQSMLATTARLSYSGMADAVRAHAPIADMKTQRAEVFLRFAYNTLMDNTDDHEKNHAYVRVADNAWSLSEAYDVLPQMNGTGIQALPAGRKTHGSSFLDAVAHHAAFGLTMPEAVDAWRQVAIVVDQWKDRFAGFGVSGRDIDYLSTFIDFPHKLALRSPDITETVETLHQGKNRTKARTPPRGNRER